MNQILRQALSSLDHTAFERLGCALLRVHYPEYASLEAMRNQYDKTRKGTPDAWAKVEAGKYVAFQFTTQSTQLLPKLESDLVKIQTTEFKDVVTRVVLGIVQPLDGKSVAVLEKIAQQAGWELEVVGPDQWIQLILKYPAIQAEYFPQLMSTTPIQDTTYNCGARLKWVRELLGLTPAQFVTLLDYPSENEWKRVEQQKREAENRTIEKVANLSSVSADWLRTGKGKRIAIHGRSLREIEAFIQELKAQETSTVFIFLSTSYHAAYIVAHIQPHQYKIYNFHFGLNFYSWDDEHYYIPLVLELFRQLLEQYYFACPVVFLSWWTHFRFEAGVRHPYQVLRNHNRFRYFLEDFCYGTGEENTRKQYGKPFKKVVQFLDHHYATFVSMAEARFGNYVGTKEGV